MHECSTPTICTCSTVHVTYMLGQSYSGVRGYSDRGVTVEIRKPTCTLPELLWCTPRNSGVAVHVMYVYCQSYSGVQGASWQHSVFMEVHGQL